MKKQLTLFAGVILMVACHNPKKAASTSSGTEITSNKLNGTWELNYITGPRIAFNGLYPHKKPVVTFNLPSTEVNGHTSCNPFSSKITIDGNKINFGDPRATMMACEGGGEQVFLKTLKQVNTYSVSDDITLTFIMGDIAMMRFVKK